MIKELIKTQNMFASARDSIDLLEIPNDININECLAVSDDLSNHEIEQFIMSCCYNENNNAFDIERIAKFVLRFVGESKHINFSPFSHFVPKKEGIISKKKNEKKIKTVEVIRLDSLLIKLVNENVWNLTSSYRKDIKNHLWKVLEGKDSCLILPLMKLLSKVILKIFDIPDYEQYLANNRFELTIGKFISLKLNDYLDSVDNIQFYDDIKHKYLISIKLIGEILIEKYTLHDNGSFELYSSDMKTLFTKAVLEELNHYKTTLFAEDLETRRIIYGRIKEVGKILSGKECIDLLEKDLSKSIFDIIFKKEYENDEIVRLMLPNSVKCCNYVAYITFLRKIIGLLEADFQNNFLKDKYIELVDEDYKDIQEIKKGNGNYDGEEEGEDEEEEGENDYEEEYESFTNKGFDIEDALDGMINEKRENDFGDIGKNTSFSYEDSMGKHNIPSEFNKILDGVDPRTKALSEDIINIDNRISSFRKGIYEILNPLNNMQNDFKFYIDELNAMEKEEEFMELLDLEELLLITDAYEKVRYL